MSNSSNSTPQFNGNQDGKVDFSRKASIFQNAYSFDDESGPPPIINLSAENYRLRYNARQAQNKSPNSTPPPEPPEPLISILIEDTPDRIPQNERHVHFFPEKDDVIPRHAQVFDIDRAIFEYNSKVEERRQLALLYAEMLCDTPSSSSSNLQQRPRFSVAQRLPVTSPFEDVGFMSGYSAREQQKQQQRLRVRAYVPSRPKKIGQTKPRPRTAEYAGHAEHLGDSLMISKVSVPVSPRRPKSQKAPTLTPGAITIATPSLSAVPQSNSNNSDTVDRSPSSTPKIAPKRHRSLSGTSATLSKGKVTGQKRYASPPPRAYRTMPAVPISRDASEPINDTYRLSPQQKMQQFIEKQKMKMEDDEEFNALSNNPEFSHF